MLKHVKIFKKNNNTKLMRYMGKGSTELYLYFSYVCAYAEICMY